MWEGAFPCEVCVLGERACTSGRGHILVGRGMSLQEVRPCGNGHAFLGWACSCGRRCVLKAADGILWEGFLCPSDRGRVIEEGGPFQGGGRFFREQVCHCARKTCLSVREQVVVTHPLIQDTTPTIRISLQSQGHFPSRKDTPIPQGHASTVWMCTNELPQKECM